MISDGTKTYFLNLTKDLMALTLRPDSSGNLANEWRRVLLTVHDPIMRSFLGLDDPDGNGGDERFKRIENLSDYLRYSAIFSEDQVERTDVEEEVR